MRARGLKRSFNELDSHLRGSRPMRARGLKPFPRYYPARRLESRPMRARGLKLGRAHRLRRVQRGRAPCGRVD